MLIIIEESIDSEVILPLSLGLVLIIIKMKLFFFKNPSQHFIQVLISLVLATKVLFSFGQGVIISNCGYPVCLSFLVAPIDTPYITLDNHPVFNKIPIANSGFDTSMNFQNTVNQYVSCDSDLIIVLYPNPSQSNFRLQVLSCRDKKLTIHIYDVMGKLISIVYGKTNKIILIGKQLKSGIYFAEVFDGNNKKSITLEKINK